MNYILCTAGRQVAVTLLYTVISGLSLWKPTSYPIPMWNLWWTKQHCNRLSEYLVSLCQCHSTNAPLSHFRNLPYKLYIILAINSIVKYNPFLST